MGGVGGVGKVSDKTVVHGVDSIGRADRRNDIEEASEEIDIWGVDEMNGGAVNAEDCKEWVGRVGVRKSRWSGKVGKEKYL